MEAHGTFMESTNPYGNFTNELPYLEAHDDAHDIIKPVGRPQHMHHGQRYYSIL